MAAVVTGGRRGAVAVSVVGVDAVVPVVVVVGGAAVPAAVVQLEGRVVPLVAGVLPADDDALAGVAQGPHVGRVYIADVGLDAVRGGQGQGRPIGGLPKLAADLWVGVEAGDIGAGGELRHEAGVASDPDEIDDVERAVGHALGCQPGQQRALGGLGRVQEGLEHVVGPRLARGQVGSGAEGGLLGEHYQKFGLLPAGGLLGHPAGDLAGGGGRRGHGGGDHPGWPLAGGQHQQEQDSAEFAHRPCILPEGGKVNLVAGRGGQNPPPKAAVRRRTGSGCGRPPGGWRRAFECRAGQCRRQRAR